MGTMCSRAFSRSRRATAEAGCHKRHCKATASCGDCGGDAVVVDSCGDDCGSACGTKTVYHNEYVTEKRTVNVVEHVKEERTRTVKVSVPTWVEEERQVGDVARHRPLDR